MSGWEIAAYSFAGLCVVLVVIIFLQGGQITSLREYSDSLREDVNRIQDRFRLGQMKVLGEEYGDLLSKHMALVDKYHAHNRKREKGRFVKEEGK